MDSDTNSCRKQIKFSKPLFLHIFTMLTTHRADYPSDIYAFAFLKRIGYKDELC